MFERMIDDPTGKLALAEDSLRLAQQSIQKRDFHNAMTIARKVQSMLNDNPPSDTVVQLKQICHKVLGDAFFSLQHYEEALTKYEESLSFGAMLGDATAPAMMEVIFRIEKVVARLQAPEQESPVCRRWRVSAAVRTSDLHQQMKTAVSEARHRPVELPKESKQEDPEETEKRLQQQKKRRRDEISVRSAVMAFLLLSLCMSLLIPKLIPEDSGLRKRLQEYAGATSGPVLENYAAKILKDNSQYYDFVNEETLIPLPDKKIKQLRSRREFIVPWLVEEESIPGFIRVCYQSTIPTLWLRPYDYGLVDLDKTRFYFLTGTPEYELVKEILKTFRVAPKDVTAPLSYLNPITSTVGHPSFIEVESGNFDLEDNPSLVATIKQSGGYFPGAIIGLHSARDKTTVCFGVDRLERIMPFKYVAGAPLTSRLGMAKSAGTICWVMGMPAHLKYFAIYFCVCICLCSTAATIMLRHIYAKSAALIFTIISAGSLIAVLINLRYIQL